MKIKQSQTHFCEACEQEGKTLPKTSVHTCENNSINTPTKECGCDDKTICVKCGIPTKETPKRRMIIKLEQWFEK